MAEMEVTPPLDDFIRDYEADDNLWWRTDCGHHQNLFEEAVERMQAAEERVDREALAAALKAHRMTSAGTAWKDMACGCGWKGLDFWEHHESAVLALLSPEETK